MGFPKNRLSSDDKQDLLDLIEDYRQGYALQQVDNTVRTLQKPLPPRVGRLLPTRALRGVALSGHPVPDWVGQQVHLHPYPKELMLRSHV